jgi:hypothetical protein
VTRLATNSKQKVSRPVRTFTGKVNIFDFDFQYRITPVKTEIFFPNQQRHEFSNWEIKGVRQQFYIDNYVDVVIEELAYGRPRTEEDHFGLTASDIRRFLQENQEKFEDAGLLEKLFVN